MIQRETEFLREGKLFSRYLVGSVPSELILERYAHAVERLFGGGEISPALRYARKRPWSLPFLDAACGWKRPDDALRRRLLVMSAILETTPDYAELFLPRHVRFERMMLAIAWNGMRAVVKLAVGIIILKLFVPRRA